MSAPTSLTAVLLHPHPDLGGNQHNNVVSAVYERLSGSAVRPHRFDFVSADLTAAHRQTAQVIADVGGPVLLVGYSFGGAVAAMVSDSAVVAWCLVAPALTLAQPTIGPDTRSKLVIAAERDQWFSPALLAEQTADWAMTTHQLAPGADHFFAGPGALEVAEQVAVWAEAAV